MEAWKLKRKMAHCSFAQYFNTLPQTPSVPHVFLVLIALKTFKTVSSEMTMSLSLAEKKSFIPIHFFGKNQVCQGDFRESLDLVQKTESSAPPIGARPELLLFVGASVIVLIPFYAEHISPFCNLTFIDIIA